MDRLRLSSGKEVGGKKDPQTKLVSLPTSCQCSPGDLRGTTNCLVEANVTTSTTISKYATVHQSLGWFSLPPNVKVSLSSLLFAKLFVKLPEGARGHGGYQTGGL